METKESLVLSKEEDPLNRLNEFCKAYSLRESDELFCRATVTLIGANFPALHDRKKTMLLDFFEALGKVMPAIYEVQAKMEYGESIRNKV